MRFASPGDPAARHRALFAIKARVAAAITGVLLACSAPAPTAPPPVPLKLELDWQRLRYWDDQIRLQAALNTETLRSGASPGEANDSLREARAAVRRGFAALDTASVSPGDRAAIVVMREAWGEGLSAEPVSDGTRATDSLALLTSSVFDAFGKNASRIVVGRDTLNRLAILSLIPRTAEPALRRQLFLSLMPVWRGMNGENEVGSPYRRLVAMRRAAWGDSASPILSKAPAFGLNTPELERWLVRALERWRATMPDTLLEPWDWYYFVGAASRQLSPRVPSIGDMRAVNDRYYRSFGADPESVHVHYDLAARPGKYPVAYTDFGSRHRWRGTGLMPGEPWVFTTYLGGDFDNLAELLHETGHAIHLAGIRTRPAFLDWPDNDTFTEALADVPALELYEPAWQLRFLGDSVPAAVALRARYAGIVFDLAWALFEIRIHRAPGVDPNHLWTGIARDYLGIQAHPEWSWWAMRGQLLDAPGYLINYALGAFMAADIRATIAHRRGSFGRADATLYPWLSAELYRYGREQPARTVLERFLGRGVRPDALLADLTRLGAP